MSKFSDSQMVEIEKFLDNIKQEKRDRATEEFLKQYGVK